MRILIVDSVTPKPYDFSTLALEGLGGTEATVLRVARGLGAKHSVMLLQHNREQEGPQFHVDFITMDSKIAKPDVIIHLRTAAHVPVYKGIFPEARQLVWMHDLAVEGYKQELQELLDAELVCVSNFHAVQFENTIKGFDYKAKPKIHTIYNIVETYGDKLNESFNPKRLLFASSPHKGLSEVIDKFKMLRSKTEQDLELGILNPGYIELEQIEEKDGIKVYGTKTHRELHKLLVNSALLFYPQTVFPETFGLVLAESHALSVPVICHDFGAAKEVLTDKSQAVDCTNNKKIVTQFQELMNKGSTTGPREEFSEASVIKAWEALLHD